MKTNIEKMTAKLVSRFFLRSDESIVMGMEAKKELTQQNARGSYYENHSNH